MSLLLALLGGAPGSSNLSAAQTLEGLSQSASVAAIAALTGAQTLDAVTQAANVEVSAGAVAITANQTLADLTQEARVGGEDRDPGTKPKPWLYAAPPAAFPAEVAALARRGQARQNQQARHEAKAAEAAAHDEDEEEILWLLAA